jgi:hypothetical protein
MRPPIVAHISPSAARDLVLATTPYYSALELETAPANTDGGGFGLHRRLRESCGVSKDEWQAASQLRAAEQLEP